jgi:hypothetical protein
MTFISKRSTIRSLKPGDKNFRISDGLVTSPRAGFEISQRCPENYKDLLVECISQGWIKPIAYITERELMFMGLSNDT